jgi:hypothetical protein
MLGLEVREGKNLAFRTVGEDRYIRATTLGYRYHDSTIKERIFLNSIDHNRNLHQGLANDLIGVPAPKHRLPVQFYKLKLAANALNYLVDQGIDSYELLEQRQKEWSIALQNTKENNDGEAYNKAFFYEPDDLLNQNDSDLGVISLTINRLEISESKMKWFVETYTNSDLAKKRSWTNDFIKNIVAVVAEYSVDYDNTKVPFQDGDISQTFYVVRKNVSSPWLILEADSPHQSEEGLFR